MVVHARRGIEPIVREREHGGRHTFPLHYNISFILLIDNRQDCFVCRAFIIGGIQVEPVPAALADSGIRGLLA
jgi:hypothetical protein